MIRRRVLRSQYLSWLISFFIIGSCFYLTGRRRSSESQDDVNQPTVTDSSSHIPAVLQLKTIQQSVEEEQAEPIRNAAESILNDEGPPGPPRDPRPALSNELPEPIRPLTNFQTLSADTKGVDDDLKTLNRTLNWLDLWNGDPKCIDYQVRLLDKKTHPAALVSYPGSGNSWLRMLLMGITGVYVDSVYPGDDAVFISKANTSYEFPTDCGCTLLQKTHDFTLNGGMLNLTVANRTFTLDQYRKRGILVIRNPLTAIRSYRNFVFGGLKGIALETAFQGPAWEIFVSRSVASWETLASVWIRGLDEGGVLYYERLRHDTRAELKRLVAMLGLSHPDEGRLECVLAHAKDNSFKRETKGRFTGNVYSASQRMLIHKAIETVQAVLKERGLDPLPLEYYEGYGDLPEYGLP